MGRPDEVTDVDIAHGGGGSGGFRRAGPGAAFDFEGVMDAIDGAPGQAVGADGVLDVAAGGASGHHEGDAGGGRAGEERRG